MRKETGKEGAHLLSILRDILPDGLQVPGGGGRAGGGDEDALHSPW